MVKFINLHAHTTFSINDGFGYPEDFMRTAFNKNMEAIAITDHGNMNALSYQVEAYHKLLEEGKRVKPIFGAEMYYINSVDDWLEKYQASAAKKKEKSTATVIEDEDNLKKKIKNFLNRRCHMLLLAQNQEGLYNLFEMVSKSYSENYLYRFPRIDFELLKRLNKGIIATSACLGGYYGSVYFQNRDAGPDKVADEMRVATEKILDIFGTSRWFGELQWNRMPEQHALNQYVIQMSQEFGFSLVSTSDAHFPDIKNWKDREIYKGLGWLGKKKKDIPETMEQMPYLLYPKSGDELWDSYLDGARVCNTEYDSDLIRESIERTHDIAFNLIEDFLPEKNIVLPDFVVPEGKTEEEHLVELSIEGLKRLELHKKANYVERLKEELHIIKDRGFCKYFLTMKQVSDKAQTIQLAGPGRGSAAGSLTAYVLGITQMDPIRWNLLFSRFLRKDAKDYPDIDFDVSDPMSLKDALIEEWGQDRVVPISNWNKLQLKSLIKDISKYYDIPWSEVNMVTNVMMVESIPAAKQAHGIRAGVYIPDFEEVMKYSESLQNFLKKYPQVEEHVEALKGQIRSCSRHAGGVVISERLNRRMPLINSGGVIQTPWTEGQQTVIHLEPMGFIKFDVLGLASLRMIEGAIKLVLERHYNCPNPTFEDVKNFYNKNLHPDSANFNDKRVWKGIFHCVSGQPGIFQLTQRGAQDFCEMVKPNNIEELTAITSIYRPGPMSANVPDLYINAKANTEEIVYEHPLIKKILKKNFGFIIFQEDLALLASTLGKNISLDEGNVLRKLFIKKGEAAKKDKLKNSLHERFIEGCVEKKLTKGQAKKLWDKMEDFSKYGFCRSLHFSELITIYNKEGKRIGAEKIMDIRSGDYVRSRDEKTKKDIFVKVKNVHNHGVLKLYEIVLDTGETVKCTKNHKFRIKDGRMLPLWKILKENLDIVVNAEKDLNQKVD